MMGNESRIKVANAATAKAGIITGAAVVSDAEEEYAPPHPGEQVTHTESNVVDGWTWLDRFAVIVGILTSIAGVAGLWAAVTQIRQANSAARVEAERWTQSGANLSIVQVGGQGVSIPESEFFEYTHLTTYPVYIVTNNGRLQIDVAGAKMVSTTANVPGTLACNKFPLTLQPGESRPIVFSQAAAQAAGVINGLEIFTASGAKESLNFAYPGPEIGGVLTVAYADQAATIYRERCLRIGLNLPH
jgi:hypothetical protein